MLQNGTEPACACIWLQTACQLPLQNLPTVCRFSIRRRLLASGLPRAGNNGGGQNRCPAHTPLPRGAVTMTRPPTAAQLTDNRTGALRVALPATFHSTSAGKHALLWVLAEYSWIRRRHQARLAQRGALGGASANSGAAINRSSTTWPNLALPRLPCPTRSRRRSPSLRA